MIYYTYLSNKRNQKTKKKRLFLTFTIDYT